MSNLVDAIVNTYTNTTELFIRSANNDRFAAADGWRVVDTLRFHAERKLKREIQDLEFWIPKQADREANAKRWANTYKAQYNGDEISTTNLTSAVAQWKAEAFGLSVMQNELQAAQAAYKELTGGHYTSVEDKPDAELPEDIASIFAEMDALSQSTRGSTADELPCEAALEATGQSIRPPKRKKA